MGEWLIYGSNGTQKATVKKLEYSGEFMGETSVSCDIYSPSPISFSIGDYLVYRGERFTIDYDATRLKQARNDTYGKGYTYENMRFLSYVGELKKCEFLDFVPSDNLIHFSQLPDFSFYAETVKDLADRLQANLDRIYTGSNAWSVQVVQGFEGKENINISVSKATCFDALRMAYDQFEATFIIRGRTITIGTAGNELETDFKYGKGNGLKTIERSVDESDRLVTRLRAYGNTTNLPANYYKNIGMRVYAPIYEIYHVSTTGCDIHFVPKLKNACFSDKNGQYSYWVTVSLDETLWLKAVASPNNHLSSTNYSVVTVGLYGSNTQAQVTQFLNQLQSGTYEKLYFKEGINVGAWPVEYREYAENVPNLMAIDRLMLPGFPELTTDPYIDASNISTLGVREKSVYFDGSDPDTPDIHPTLEGMTAAELRAAGYTIDLDAGDNGNLDEIAADATETDGSPITADGAFEGVDEVPGFKVSIKDIGFDINDYLSTETATLVMKTGMCGGREFTIVKVEKVGNKYVLECQRTEDVSHYFPYNPYLIKAGDKFVLTNIEMPKAYIDAASQRLLVAAQAYIAKYSVPQWVYAIKMDDIWMQRQRDNSVSEASSYYWNIKEGDVMNVTDSDLGVDIAEVIDRLTIREGYGPIPEFEVVLRKEKPQGTIGVLQNRIRQLELRNAEQVDIIRRQQNYLTFIFGDTLADVMSQLDKKAETWYQASDPSSAWTNDEDKAEHVGDLWMDTSANGGKKTYIYQNTGTSDSPNYQWVEQFVPDEVFDEIDGKAEIFVEKPTAYHERDMWILENGISSSDLPTGCVAGDIVISSTDSTSFNKAHWSKKDRYTDDSSLNAFLNGYTGTLTGIRNDITNAATAASNAQTSANNASSSAAQAKAAADALDYLKQAYLADNTLIDHGLILSTIVALRDSNNNVWSGISGAYDSTKLGNGIAAWYGGGMIDKEVSAVSNAAKSLFRFDGSGYVASGNLKWDANGNVTIQGYSINATTLQVGGSNVATQAMLDNFVSKAFFNRLFTAYDANGNAIVPNDTTTAISNLKIMVGAWTEQYLSALGQNSSGGGGGGAGLEDVWDSLTNQQGTVITDNTKIAIAHIPDTSSTYGYLKASALNGYATQTWVNQQGFLTTHQTLYTLSIYGGTTKVLDFKPNANASIYIKAGGDISLTNDTTNKYITLSYTHPTNGANTTISAANGKVLSAITVNNLGHVTSVSSKTLASADIPDLSGTYATASRATTLEGYFTNGVANTAAKLNTGTTTYTAWGQTYWSSGVPQSISGNMTSVGSITPSANGNALGTTSARFNIYGTAGNFSGNVSITGTLGVTGATTLTGLLTANGGIVVPSSKTIKVGDCTISWDSTNSMLKFDTGIYSTGAVSALGSNSSGGGSGTFDEEAMWTALGTTSTAKVIASSHIPNLAASKITSGTFAAARIPNLSWTKITSDKPTTLSGYGVLDDAYGRYYALYGGTKLNNSLSSTNKIDLDDYVTPGSYYCSAIADSDYISNKPIRGAFRMWVTSSNGVGAHYRQRYQLYNSMIAYERWKLSGNAWTEWYTVQDNLANYAYASSLDDYLPLSGGTMTGAVTFKAGNATSTSQGFNLGTTGHIGASSTAVGIYSTGSILLRPSQTLGEPATSVGLSITNTSLTYNSYPILHSNNYSSYALPLSGGTITGNLTVNGTTTLDDYLTTKTYIDVDRSPYGAISLGYQLNVLRARCMNAGTGTFAYNSVISLFGSGETGTTVNNLGVRLGSTSGATWISAGESGKTLSSQYTDMCNTESVYITADNQIKFFTNCSNDGTSFTDAATINSSGDLTVARYVYATSFHGDLSGNSASTTALKNLYNQSTRPTSANLTHITNGGVQHFKATSSMTTGKPVSDAHILHFHWDGDAYDAQMAITTAATPTIQYRTHSTSGNTFVWGSWITALTSSNYSNYALPLSGGEMTGPLTWKNATALSGVTSTNYVLCIDGFADGGTTHYITTANLSVGSATKATQDGDGNTISSTYLKLSGGTITGNLAVKGYFYLRDNAKALYTTDTANNVQNTLELDSSNHLQIGYGTAGSGYNTYLHGNNLYLRYGTSRTVGLMLNSSGSVGIGTTTPSYKLHVYGQVGVTTASQGTMRLVSAASINYIQSGNAAFDDSADMIICGAGGALGTNLDLKFNIVKATNVLKVKTFLMLGYGAEGIYLTGTGINWHNASDTWTKSIMGFASTGLVTVVGNLTAGGEVTASSDERKKNIISNTKFNVKDIAAARSVLFEWNDDRDKDNSKKIHGGSIAQDWLGKADSFLSQDNDGFYSINYGALALCSAITIAREVLKHSDEIDRLKQEVSYLKARVAELEERRA